MFFYSMGEGDYYMVEEKIMDKENIIPPKPWFDAERQRLQGLLEIYKYMQAGNMFNKHNGEMMELMTNERLRNLNTSNPYSNGSAIKKKAVVPIPDITFVPPPPQPDDGDSENYE